jgi:tetratricopeptide (TPR) repeat protein
MRPPRIVHCTSEPYRFFGRSAELALLDRSLTPDGPNVVALVGPGGQGKTAIVQHWLEQLSAQALGLDGLFLWSFYRGKDADACLRELYGYAIGRGSVGDVSASWCVDQLLSIFRSETWAIVLDGAEVVQYDGGAWGGRFLHPELGRLLEELASEPMPGAIVLTTRFELPTLQHRPFARIVGLTGLDIPSARDLLASLGVQGTSEELDAVAAVGGCHAKAVELLGTYLVRFQGARADRLSELPPAPDLPGAGEEELRVARVLSAFQRDLAADAQDVLALATAFREPPAEDRLLTYLSSDPTRSLLHGTWGRTYRPFQERDANWLSDEVSELVRLRLLERVHRAGLLGGGRGEIVIDAHPLVRRGFEHALGLTGRRQGATARAGFLRGRPDRRRPNSLDEAREEVELFHAFCDAGLWTEADSVLVALENPKHRLLVPALERDLLLRFFPEGDFHQLPLWPGFGRWRSLAIAFELLGQYDEALDAYRPADFALRGDALLARGELEPLLNTERLGGEWDSLWHAYRAHALAVAGHTSEAVALAQSLVPVDIYEWVHVFECLLRADALVYLELHTLAANVRVEGQAWAELGRRRMRADLRRHRNGSSEELIGEYHALIEDYDRAGLPWERALTRLSLAALHRAAGDDASTEKVASEALHLGRQYGMRIVVIDSGHYLGVKSSGDGLPDRIPPRR